jgi:deubiquitinase DESI2
MSHFAGGGGGRTRVGTKVFLNVYDLQSGPVQDALFAVGCALHHSGVEVLGTEYSFASNVGIFSSSPRAAPPGVAFREQVELGAFEGTAADLRSILTHLEAEGGFGPTSYHLLRRNCNHFASAFCYKLLQRRIPAYVNRISALALCCDCLIPKAVLGHAPVGDSTAGGGPEALLGSSSRSQVQPFTGSGMKLGAASRPASNRMERQAPQNSDDLTDRRERARMAALARLEANNKGQHE